MSEEHFNTLDVVERTEEDTNDPAEDWDLGASDLDASDLDAMDEMIVDEAPMAEPIPASEPVADESAMSKPIPNMAPMGAPMGAPVGETKPHKAPIGTNAGSAAALLDREESEQFCTRWNEIQSKFVDDPRSAVQQADALVAEVVGQITQMFANEQSSLGSQWNQGNGVSTEDLRQALQRYRSFLNRLVA